MGNENHHGTHCAGLCEGQAYSSRIKELAGENERLRGDAAEAEGVIGELLNALQLSHEHMKLHIRNYNEGWYVYDCVISTLALAKARVEQP